MTEMVAVCMAFVKNIKKKHVPFGEGGNRESRENEKKDLQMWVKFLQNIFINKLFKILEITIFILHKTCTIFLSNSTLSNIHMLVVTCINEHPLDFYLCQL